MQQSGSGSGYGLSQEATSFVAAGMLDPLQQQKPGEAVLAEAASPISSRPPAQGNFDELGHVPGGFADEENLVGEEAERGVSGNRWPRQETLALLKIRSDMDATFKDATLKGPLWEEVSRKLADLGYSRSAKKCKEKFENVHKYYKRTKEGRAGRQDGKSYRFFTQLEALYSSSNNPIATTASATPSPPPISPAIAVSNSMAVPSSSRIQPSQAPAPSAPTTQINIQQVGHDSSVQPAIRESVLAAGISFSSSSSSSSDSEDEMEEGPSEGVRKRKRSGSGGERSQKMMAFFEGLMRQVMEKQEMMQQRFLEAIEKREQERMAREEAWKRQEMARMNHEHEIILQERAMSASRDATVVAFLQKLATQTVQIPQLVTISTAPPPQPPQLVSQPAAPPPKPQPEPSPPTPPPPQPPPILQQQKQQQEQHKTQNSTISSHDLPSSSEIIVAQQEQQEVGTSFDPVSSSRWPKSEVVALIKLRTELESSYQDSGPKGPLWEEISRGMQQLGFKRSSKRCKEKWENINKYYKKVKESNKKRPEDAKTCPYFPQLDELYQKKILGSGSVGLSGQNRPEQDMYLNPNRPKTMPSQPQVATDQAKSSNTDSKTGEGGSSSQVQTSNGVPMKKPEDIVKELIEQQRAVMDHIDKQEEPAHSDNLDQDNEDNDEVDDEEDMNTGYQIQFQRQNTGSSKGGNPATSFLAMVQ